MLTTDDIKLLANRFPTRKFKKASIVLYQGEVPRHTYLILEGSLKVYSINAQGEERIVKFYVKNDIFPTAWTYGPSAAAPYYYETLTDCRLVIIPQEEFEQLALSQPAMLKRITDYYQAANQSSQMRISALEQAKAAEKLTYTLFYLMQSYGTEIHKNIYKINISLTQQMVASLIGLTRETTANELMKLKKQKILSYKSQRYMIHKQRLLTLMGEESFMNL